MTVHITDIGEPRAANMDALPIRPGASGGGIYRIGVKRAIDVALVLLSAPFILPFIAIVALFISLDGHSPFFRQERIGKDGRRFSMWKFRTMVPDAEALLEKHLEANPMARLEWAAKQKLTHDPRCTRIGRMLRRSSLDELPQLFNVLTGDMSLVGPRPMLPSQQALYPGHAYYDLRPGMTGNWQVSERNESEFRARAHYDDLYDLTVSFATDLGILARTAVVVLRGTGC